MREFISKIKPWAKYLPVVVFLGILPFVWDLNNMLDASLLPRQLALSFFLIAMTVTFAVLFFKGQRFCFDGKCVKIVFGGLAIFMLMHLISWAFGVVNGYEAFFRTVKEFGFCLFFLFIYQLIVNDYRGRDLILKFLLVAGAVFIIIGIIQFLKADFSKFEESTRNLSYYLNSIIEEIYSTCSNKNLFSSILFLTLPVSVYCMFCHDDSHRALSLSWQIFAGIVSIADLALIIIMLTRTVWAALALALVVAYILSYARKVQTSGGKVSLKTKLIYIGVPAGLVVIMIAVFALTDTQLERTVVERVAITFNPEKYGYRDNEHGESSVAMRKLVWGKTLEMVKDHPILGAGPGQWQIELPKYGLDEFGAKLRDGSLTFQRPHNDYLWFASEVGIIGLLGYLIFYVGILFAGLSNIKRTTNGRVALFNIVAVAALTGWIVVSLLDYPHERIEHNVFYLTISAIVLADYAKRVVADNQAEQSGNPTITMTILVFGLIVSGLHLWQTWAYYKGEKNGRLVLAAYYHEDWNAVVRLTRNVDAQMYTLDNYTVPIHYYRGVALSFKDNDKAAIGEFEQALEKHPNHMLSYCGLGASLMRMQRYDEAIKYVERVLEMSPRNSQALFDMAIIHYNKREFKQALDYMLKLPLVIESGPRNYEATRRSICRAAVAESAPRYNRDNLLNWLNNDSRVDSSIKRYYSDSCSFDELILKELGPNNQ
ncbi:MAG: O-antigen ligase family protein [Salinivirgaceae bacterium]|nr:O-antigen ligase family protein [Salinivirgaceae bacterium]